MCVRQKTVFPFNYPPRVNDQEELVRYGMARAPDASGGNRYCKRSHTHEIENGQADIRRAGDWLLDLTLARPGDLAVGVSQSKDATGTPDTLQVVTLPA
jgi:hypothetical protein